MNVSLNTIRPVSFASVKNDKKQDAKSENPISLEGERSKLRLGVFCAGLGFGVKCLAELIDGDFVGDVLIDTADRVVDKNFKNAKSGTKIIAGLGAIVGVLGLFIGGIALLYTAFKTPKINYDSKVNTFTKTKDMDVYIKSNAIETQLYTQLNEQAKEATQEEKENLKEQYAMLRMSKTQVPEFVKFLK